MHIIMANMTCVYFMIEGLLIPRDSDWMASGRGGCRISEEEVQM